MQVYEIRADRITITDSRTEPLIEKMLDDSTAFPDGEPETRYCLSCPVCGATENLTLRGNWNGLDSLKCPAGHEWHPWPAEKKEGQALMRNAITTFITAGK